SKGMPPRERSRENFIAFVEWVLEKNGPYFSICPTMEDISSPIPEPDTSQLSSCCNEQVPDSTVDGEPKPAMTEPIIAPEPELQESSDQVCEPVTSSVPEGVLGNPSHTPDTE
ncbi:hypothetical protein M9458_017248, partial [Cirrhinus mrigala]